jgi:hypothetical protein
MLRALKKAVKLPKIEFLDWLASSEGPAPTASLRTFRPSARSWLAIWFRRAWLRQFQFPVPRRYLYVPASQRVKVTALLRYAREYGLVNFVETGTYLGDTTSAIAPMFCLCFSVEISPELHARSRKRLSKFANVSCILGDSSLVLPEIVRKLNGPSLFWLDAHASGGETFSGGKDPLLAELEAIYSSTCSGHVILIDDARGHDIAAIRSFCGSRARVDVRNDIIRIAPIR